MAKVKKDDEKASAFKPSAEANKKSSAEEPKKPLFEVARTPEMAAGIIEKKLNEAAVPPKKETVKQKQGKAPRKLSRKILDPVDDPTEFEKINAEIRPVVTRSEMKKRSVSDLIKHKRRMKELRRASQDRKDLPVEPTEETFSDITQETDSVRTS